MKSVNQRIAEALSVKESQTQAAIDLLDGGATVPFIARYRKEMTSNLDDTQLRFLEERLHYLRELETRREAIIKSITEQGKLTDTLERSVLNAETKTALEDLYLPYKPKRRTKAQTAREAGLEPLATALFENPDLEPESEAAKYLNSEHKINEVKEALLGAKHILMERFAEEASLLSQLRETLWQQGVLTSTVKAGKEVEGEKFSDYFAYNEAIRLIPSHRALALFRGRNESILTLELTGPEADPDWAQCVSMIAKQFGIENHNRPADAWLQEVVSWTWKIKLFFSLFIDLSTKLHEQAEQEAIAVFAKNLKDVLMAAPAGQHVTLGLDPGLRTGVKVVVVDATGRLLEHTTIFPHVPKNQWDQSLDQLNKLCRKHKVSLVSIGNGTGSRETDKLVLELIKQHPDLKLNKLVVSESGASIYSASAEAAAEFPDLDVSFRGAVSIARRLQDPLAELVKIEPKSIGVGQYQHDVNQFRLARSLNAVVEDCVNSVGVDVNTASVPLLTRVSGLNDTLASNIVLHRDQNGRFNNRKELKKISRMGPKSFEQAAGFLRITEGDNPLDRSAVHPEAYPLISKILAKKKLSITELMGQNHQLKDIKAMDWTDEQFGLATVEDILNELEKPGRDPRPEFKTASFKEGIEKLSDLTPGMRLEGVVTNVANFGAFVDIGVHQDGLVHISQLADRFVKDPREVVKAGDIVQVKVQEIDIKRKRISLTMRQDATPTEKVSKKPEKISFTLGDRLN